MSQWPTGARLRDAHAQARAALAAFLPDREAEREARLLLGFALGLSQAGLLSRMAEGWPEAHAQARFAAALEARLARRPLAQIVGEWDFYGRPFAVTPDTLTPRPDTEALVDLALSAPFTHLLDLGTGTGAIAVTLLAERPAATAVATDISDAALAVAARNAASHGVAERLHLQRADWLEGVTGRFDLIVSNPPYVTEAFYLTLSPEITLWEPRAALTPGGDGLDAYRAICAGALPHLTPKGRLLVEIGPDQGAAVAGLFHAAGLGQVAVHPDLNGKDRIVAGLAP